MKTLIIFATAAVIAGSALAQGNLSAPIVQRRALPPLSPAQSEGSLQRGARIGNPLQMINPFAPAQYGSVTDFLTPADTSKVQPRKGHMRPEAVGFRLISFSF